MNTVADKIITEFSSLPDNLKNCVVVFGNFDGVHRGHQALIATAKEIANDLVAPLLIFTFKRHPRLCFDKALQPFLITSLETKLLYLCELNVNGVLVLDFATIQPMTADEFMQTVIVDNLQAKAVVVGDDFRFGKNRSGDINSLLQNKNFKTIIIDEKTDGEGNSFASTNIRNFIKIGSMGKVTMQLGRPFEIYSRVIKGQQLGGKIGFPTANIKFEDDIIRPKYGVYAVKVNIVEQHKWCEGVANFGIRPTVDDNTETLEVHLFDFNEDIYDAEIRVSFIQFIRSEQKFENIAELKQTIGKDCDIAKQIHRLRNAGG